MVQRPDTGHWLTINRPSNTFDAAIGQHAAARPVPTPSRRDDHADAVDEEIYGDRCEHDVQRDPLTAKDGGQHHDRATAEQDKCQA